MSDGTARGRKGHPIQDRLARLLGVPTEGRGAIVQAMFKRHSDDAVSYWLQLILATGIATFGLVLSSAGVVIGAMLIAPLMAPIVELGMGLAVGAPLLTLRSMFRVGASIVWVVGLAALLTIGLPFHETTAEIAARTSPTLLDLAVAAFCALAAGFTTARQSADTASAAAGTAIGISLVPPLCAAGYGFGVGQASIFSGALLLFTANFCAIIFCSTLLFLALGFNHVRLDEDVERGLGARLARGLRRVFGTRYGVVWRVILPTMLLAGVFVPLRAALGEVAWKIQVRDAVTRILRDVAPEDRSVRTSLVIEPNKVHVRLALIGSPEDARAIEQELRVRVAAAAGVAPDVDVTAVADDVSLRRIAESVAAPRPTPVLPPPPPPPPPVSALRKPVDEALAAHWPAVAGAIQRWELEVEAGAPTLRIRHVGEPLGRPAEALLADFLELALGEAVIVRADTIPTGRWTAEGGITSTFLSRLAGGLSSVQAEPQLRACVTRAAVTAAESALSAATPTVPEQTADLLLETFAGPRVEVREGAVWTLELVVGACPEPAPTPAPEPPVP